MIWDYFFSQEIDFIWVIIFIICSLLCLYFFPKHFDKKALKHAKKVIEEWKNKSILWKQEMTFTKEYLFVKTSGTEQKIYWSKIYKIVENNNYIFIFITSLSAFVIPKKSILWKEKELWEFLKEIQK